MKKLAAFFLLFITFTLFAGDGESAYWSSDFRKTRVKAKEAGKNLFLLFTISDGSMSNRRAIQLFRHSAFLKEAGEEFYFLHIDFPKNKKLVWHLTAQNRRLKNRFGVSFFPAIVIVSPSSPWGGLLYKHNENISSWQETLADIRKKVKRPNSRPKPPARRVGEPQKTTTSRSN